MLAGPGLGHAVILCADGLLAERSAFDADQLIGSKTEQYAQLLQQARGLLSGERDRIANAANLSALAHRRLALAEG